MIELRPDKSSDLPRRRREHGQKLPTIPDPTELITVSKQDGIYVLKAKYSKEIKSPMNYFQAIVSTHDVGISFLKESFYDVLPAREPMPDGWFVWEE